jgi:hypothetical protein
VRQYVCSGLSAEGLAANWTCATGLTSAAISVLASLIARMRFAEVAEAAYHSLLPLIDITH